MEESIIDNNCTTRMVNVYGSCVARNPFNSKVGAVYRVRSFVQRNNPLLVGQKGLPDRFEDTDVEVLKSYLTLVNAKGMLEIISHPFNIRMLKALINGESEQYLLEKKAPWIILDTFYLYSDVLLRITRGDKEYYFKTDKTFTYLLKTVIQHNPKYANYQILEVDASLNIAYYMRDLSSFLSKNWNNNIIIINARPAQYYNHDNVLIHTEEPPEAAVQSDSFIRELIKQTPAHIIELPRILVSKDDLVVHYLDPYMEYIKIQIDHIIEETRAPATAD